MTKYKISSSTIVNVSSVECQDPNTKYTLVFSQNRINGVLVTKYQSMKTNGVVKKDFTNFCSLGYIEEEAIVHGASWVIIETVTTEKDKKKVQKVLYTLKPNLLKHRQ